MIKETKKELCCKQNCPSCAGEGKKNFGYLQNAAYIKCDLCNGKGFVIVVSDGVTVLTEKEYKAHIN